jgi:hypothetical protein
MSTSDLPRRKVTQKDIEFQKVINEGRFRERLVDAAVIVLFVGLCILGLYPLRPIVALLAGEETKVSVSIGVSFSAVLTIGGYSVYRHRRKDREQAGELERLRARLEEYDQDVLS